MENYLSVLSRSKAFDVGWNNLLSLLTVIPQMAREPLIECIIASYPEPTYSVDLYCVRAYQLKSIWFKMGSGSITFSLKKNGAFIPGLTDLVATTSIQNAVATAGNNFQIGDNLTLVVTVSSSAVDFAATVETEYASL
jgi:hypothetical protein